MSHLVSIIIPTYNRCNFLGETLESVMAQEYQNWECIIVDDGSPDHTEELVSFYCEKDKRINYYKRPDSLKKGANSCRNYGFLKCKGDYINWFDDDDIMLPNFLSARAHQMESGLEILICSYFPVDRVLNKESAISLKKSYSLFRSYALYELKLITNSLLINRGIFKDKVMFKLGLEYGDETELFLRIFYQVPEPSHIIINKPLFLYREHETSKTKQNEKPNSSFRFSVIFVALQNMSRGIEMKDPELTRFYFKRLISLFFRSLEDNQRENAAYLLSNLFPLMRRINSFKSFELWIWGRLFILFGKGSYKIEKRLKFFLNTISWK